MRMRRRAVDTPATDGVLRVFRIVGGVEPARRQRVVAEVDDVVRTQLGRRTTRDGERAMEVGEGLVPRGRVHHEVRRGVEVGARVATFGLAVVEEVFDRVDAGPADVGVPPEVPVTIEVR